MSLSSDTRATASSRSADTPFRVGRISTGNRQIDEILGGGLPRNSINVIMGQPGTGKTIFAEQVMYHNAGGDRPLLYLTTLSEPLSKQVTYVQQFSYFDAEKLGRSIVYDDVGQTLADEGPEALPEILKSQIKAHSPAIIVIDSFRAVHDLASNAQQARRMVSTLAGLLSAYESTTILVGEYAPGDIDRYPEFAVADSIIELARTPLTTRDERFLRVLKLRGSSYREGQHAFRIGETGLEVYPRLVSPRVPQSYTPRLERVTTGVPGLDEMLGGGLWAGSSTLIVGSTGTGKTTAALQYAVEGLHRGEPVAYVNFQENPAQLHRSLLSLDPTLEKPAERGFHHLYRSPVEFQIDSIIVDVFQLVREKQVKRVIIDAIDDLASAAADPHRLRDYLYSLVQHFTAHGVTSLLTFESADAVPGPLEARFSYMADNVITLGRRSETALERTIRIVKTRNSGHDERQHRFEISAQGGRVL